MFMKHIDIKHQKAKEDQMHKEHKNNNNFRETNKEIISNTVVCILETTSFATFQILFLFQIDKGDYCFYVGLGNVGFMCFIATIGIFMVFGLLAICLLLLNLVPDIFGVCRGSRSCNIWVWAARASKQG